MTVCHPGIMVTILSSGRRLSFLYFDFVLGCIDIGLLLLFEEAFIVKATVSRCTLEDSSSFQRCSNLVSHTRVSSFSCNDDVPNYSMMALVLEDDFEFILATFSLVTTVNHFVNDCPNLKFLPSFLLHGSHRDVLALTNILRDVLVLLDVADVLQCNEVDFPSLLYLCLLYDILSFLFHFWLFIWNQHCLG